MASSVAVTTAETQLNAFTNERMLEDAERCNRDQLAPKPVECAERILSFDGIVWRMEPWELVETGDGSAGFMQVQHRRFRLPDGCEAVWDVFGPAATVAVLAVTPRNEVVLAREFRAGPMRVLDEMPGGLVDPGEGVLEAAGRELLEKTGYAGDLELVGSTWLAASANTRRHAVVARNARRVAEPTLVAGELIETRLVSLDEFRQHLRSGQLTDVDLGYLSLDHLGLLG